MRAIFGGTGRAYVVGVTGPPGAGKSTLVDRLTADIRAAAVTVGVLTVDPISPFTGGAVLGDRAAHAGARRRRRRVHPQHGDARTPRRARARDRRCGARARCRGKDVIIIETVGVGQDEVDIIRTADVSIVTLVPGAGDDVQALKAGIMEIADIFVVNKADQEGADRLVGDHRIEPVAADVRAGRSGGRRSLKTIATSGDGGRRAGGRDLAFPGAVRADTGRAPAAAQRVQVCASSCRSDSWIAWSARF